MATDMTGRVCVVTGATSGIGLETAKALARMGATVGLAARDRRRGEAAVEAAVAAAGGRAPRPRLFLADLSSLNEVRRLAGEVLAAWDRLDVLVNNAGAVIGRKTLSADGIELTFALNHLAPFLLTCRLLERLQATPGSRVVTVASRAHYYGSLDFGNLRGEKGYAAQRMYGRSKLANILFTILSRNSLRSTRRATRPLLADPSHQKTVVIEARTARGAPGVMLWLPWAEAQ